MRVLIIGGTGLISTPITRLLAERGDEVTLFNRGVRPVPVPGGVQRLVGDRRDFAAFEQRMQELSPFDCVIDMICYLPDEAESLMRAFGGRVGQLIVCSTVDVYEKQAPRLPFRDDAPHGGLGDYAVNKVRCEAILRAAYEAGRFPLTILRPAHTYHDGGTLIHSLGGRTTYLDRLRRGKSIVVHGDGNSLWVSCHAQDVGRAFVAAIGNAKTFGRSYHLPGEEWMTWNQYHQKVARAMGAPPPTLVHIPTDLLARVAPTRCGICATNFQYNNIFDDTAARADLDFRVTIPFETGAGRIYRFLDANGRIENSDDDPLEDEILAAWTRLSEEMALGLKG